MVRATTSLQTSCSIADSEQAPVAHLQRFKGISRSADGVCIFSTNDRIFLIPLQSRTQV